MTVVDPTTRPTDQTPQADAVPVGQSGDMIWADHYNTKGVNPDTGLDAVDTAAMRDAGAHAVAATTDKAAAPTTDLGQKAVQLAQSQLGVNYVYGAHQWGKALDCSGLTQQVMAQMGIQIGNNTYTQVQQGQAVQGGIQNAKPGDLIFVTGDVGMRKDGHVAIYIGGGKVIAAPHTGAVVQVQDWSNKAIDDIRRFF